MSEFRDEHDALERELLDYFRAVLGPRLIAPMAEELKAAVRDGLSTLGERERRIEAALQDLANDRAALATAVREQGAAVAADARRRLSAEAPPSGDAAALAAIEQKLEALAAQVAAGARRVGSGAAPGPVAGLTRNQLIFGGGGLAALALAIGLVIGLLVPVHGRQAPAEQTVAADSQDASNDGQTGTQDSSTGADTPVDQGWSVLRAASPGVCGGLTGEACAFNAAWTRGGGAERRGLIQAALDLLASRARANYPGCRRAGIAAPHVASWSPAAKAALTALGGCLGVAAPEIDAHNPTDAQQLEVMTWALGRLSFEAAR